MRTICSVVLMLGIAPDAAPARTAAMAQEPASGSLAAKTRAICDAIQAHHVEAPTRQQMIHSGIVGMYRAVNRPLPTGLGERISGLTTHEQFAALLAEVRPKPGGEAATEPELDKAFLQGLSDGVPGGATLVESKENKVIEQIAGNRYVGIQIQVGTDEETKLPKIQGLLPGGPALRAGMKEGDIIEAVDGADLGGGSLQEYIDKLRGAEGTDVTVRARRAGEKEPLTFRMTRQAMSQPTIAGPEGAKSYRLPGPDPIGYIKINEILASTPREVREAAASMEAEGLKAMILDLRGGKDRGLGNFHSTVLLADELLDAGTIGRVRLAGRGVTYRAEPGAVFRDRPIAVLVDRGTIDHGEWLAAALQDNKRAKLVGVTTAGMGATRSSVPVGDGSQTMTLVTGLLERADGQPIGYYYAANLMYASFRTGMVAPGRVTKLGVSPDVLVREDEAGHADSRPLKAAVELLRKTLDPPAGANVGGRDAAPSATDGRGTR